MRKLRAAADATRPWNAAMAMVAVAVGGLVVPSFDPGDATSLVVASLIAGLVTGAGNVLNDVFDADIDAVNRPERPIPRGRISKREAVAVAASLLAVSLVGLGQVAKTLVVAIAVFNAVALLGYSWKLKRTPLVGNSTVAYLVGSAFLFGGAAVGGISESLPLFLVAFAATLGREVAKDVEDLPGDSGRAETLATALGSMRASQVAALSMGITVLVSPLPYLAGVLGPVYLPFAAVADALLLYASFRLAMNPDEEGAAAAQRLVKLAMVAALAGFVAGSL